MRFLKKAYKILSYYIDITFLLKFIILGSGLYYFTLFYIGVADPKGRVYSSFIANHLDYISWLRMSILRAANLITTGFGLDTYVSDIYTLKVHHGTSVIIGLTCIGYGLMSFWVAFIIAQRTGWRKKVAWCLAGIAAIWFINCWRVAVLLIALQNKWQVNKFMDHHEMFNNISYILIILLIYKYYQVSKKEDMAASKVHVKTQPQHSFPVVADMAVK